VFGALLPATVLPFVYSFTAPWVPYPAGSLASAFFLVLVVYYLVWKHVVGFLNRVVGL
jgi:hypothetical protein